MRVEESRLQTTPVPLAAGGTAEILQCTVAGRPMLYKRYKRDYLPKVEIGALDKLVQWRDGLARGTRQQLDERCAWPTATVHRHGLTVGFLMPATPPGFAVGTQPARTVSKLRRSDPDLPPTEVLPATVEALAAFGLHTQTMLWLHDLGVVVNDVQPLNVLVSADGVRVYLVDCDAMLGPWGQVGPPAAPVYFNELIRDPPSPEVDLAKLAWCMFFILLDDFSLRRLGRDVQQQALRYLPKGTVDLLVRTAACDTDVTRLRHLWAEQASSWISCARGGVLILDDGWHQVVAERPGIPVPAQRVLAPTMPLHDNELATVPARAAVTVRTPVRPSDPTESSLGGSRSASGGRVWAVGVAVLVIAVAAVVSYLII